MAKRKPLTIDEILENATYNHELITLSIKIVAEKIRDGIELTRKERNLAENILQNHAAKLLEQSAKAKLQKKSDEIDKVKHREKVFRYRIKKIIEKLTKPWQPKNKKI